MLTVHVESFIQSAKYFRFIIYAFPMLNVAAAVACARIWDSAKKSRSLFGFIGVSVVVGHLLGNVVCSGTIKNLIE